MRKDYDWNCAFNYVMEIKDKYIAKFGNPVEYNLKQWVSQLNDESMNEFVENLFITSFKDMALLRYNIACRDMYTNSDSIYRECRSLVIDLKNEAIVLAPFRKFFNLNEVPENSMEIVEEKIRNAKNVEFSVKLDGSMQSFRYYNGEIISSGSQALDADNSWRLQDGVSRLTDGHKQMIKKNEHLTFIFEYISEQNLNVVAYGRDMDGMHLIGARSVYNGKQLSYQGLHYLAMLYEIKTVPVESVTMEDVMKLIDEKRSDEFEGWVLNISDNEQYSSHQIKIKCNDYVKIHRVLSAISSVNVIIESIANDTYDDLYAKIPEGHKERVNNVANKIFSYVKQMNHDINKAVDAAPKDDRKTFMLWVEANCDKNILGYVRAKYLGKEYHVLKGSAGGCKKASDIGLQPKLNLLDE